MSEETLLEKIARWEKQIEDMEKRLTFKWCVDEVRKEEEKSVIKGITKKPVILLRGDSDV